MDIRAIILKRLGELGKSKYWLAETMQEQHKDVCKRETVYRFLRGERDTSTLIVGAMLELLGLEIKPASARKKPVARQTPQRALA